MNLLKTITDPLGNHVQFPLEVNNASGNKLEDITDVVASPSFLINEQNRKLYFFGLVRKDTNVMVEAQFVKDHFVVKGCIRNPTIEYISGLLKRGRLLSFQV